MVPYIGKWFLILFAVTKVGHQMKRGRRGEEEGKKRGNGDKIDTVCCKS